MTDSDLLNVKIFWFCEFIMMHLGKWLRFGLVVAENLQFKGHNLAFLSDTFAPIDPWRKNYIYIQSSVHSVQAVHPTFALVESINTDLLNELNLF